MQAAKQERTRRRLATYEAFYDSKVVPCMRNPTWQEGLGSRMFGTVVIHNGPDHDYHDWLRDRLGKDNPEWIVSVKTCKSDIEGYCHSISLAERLP